MTGTLEACRGITLTGTSQVSGPAELPDQEMDRLTGDHPWLRLFETL